ncbi:RNA methyltransferase [Alphaproteobacteria bacterium]|nr:RNA methyltransferase [Alphaproteobacteria bacterium]
MIQAFSIILVRPQLGENIGLVARAMGNFGFSDLRIVSPRAPWPNPSAESASVGAGTIVKKARVFSSLESATKDLHYTLCATARDRSLKKERLSLKESVVALSTLSAQNIGLVFGPEQAGLTNEEISLTNESFFIPTNPGLRSLNLSHAVLVCLYELSSSSSFSPKKVRLSPASHEEVSSFLRFLERSLERSNFFYPLEKKDKMKQNLRDIFLRLPLTSPDTKTLYGAVKSLVRSVDKKEI